MRIVISSGHSKYVGGASHYINEVEEARRVVDRTAEILEQQGVGVVTFHDNTSNDQDENLERIVDFHNEQTRDLDISVHFNSATFNGSDHTSNPVGTETYYYSSGSQENLADRVSEAISYAGKLKNRGAKPTSSLYFLNNTEEPALLLEICFVNSSADVAAYQANFDAICGAIAEVLSGQTTTSPEPPTEEALFRVSGKCSSFGGPDDTGVSPSEGLAFIYDVDEAPHLFLPYQPSGTSGLARRLNPNVPYIACRWDYSKTPKDMLKSGLKAKVISNGWEIMAYPADWGPHEDTGRVADLSPGLMEALWITTDDEVEVIFPYES